MCLGRLVVRVARPRPVRMKSLEARMSWCRPRVRRTLQLALGLMLTLSTLMGSSGRAIAVPVADELARDWLERTSTTIGQSGRIMRAQVTVRDQAEGSPELTTQLNVWIDGDARKARLEARRDNSIISVLVVDNWEAATYDAALNTVTKVTVPDEARANVRNPAYSVLTPSLISAYQAGQINPLQEVTANASDTLNGRPAVRLTLSRPETIEVPVAQQGAQSGQQPASPPRTEQRTIVQ